MKRLHISATGPVLELDYVGERATAPAVKSVQGSRRYTSSSRHPGRRIEGVPTKLADAGLGVLDLCACGCRREAHPEMTRHEFTRRKT